MAAWFDKWLGRAANAITFVGPIVPGTIAGIVTGYLSRSVAWVSQYGAFGWWLIGLTTFVVITATLAISARSKLWKITAHYRERLSRDSSTFDPMEPIFRNKRIRVIDLVNQYDQVVLNKKFINCEIIGPANIFIVFANAKFTGNGLEFSDAVEIRDNAIPNNAVAFANCDFEKCRFFKVTMLFQTQARKEADKLITNLHWLTEIEEPSLELEENSTERRDSKISFDVLLA